MYQSGSAHLGRVLPQWIREGVPINQHSYSGTPYECGPRNIGQREWVKYVYVSVGLLTSWCRWWDCGESVERRKRGLSKESDKCTTEEMSSWWMNNQVCVRITCPRHRSHHPSPGIGPYGNEINTVLVKIGSQQWSSHYSLDHLPCKTWRWWSRQSVCDWLAKQ